MSAGNEGAASRIASIDERAEYELERVSRARGSSPASAFENARSPALVVCTIEELLAKDLPPRVMLLSPWLESQSVTMIYSWRGVGKTHVALGIAYALASGGSFLEWNAPTPQRVLYIDGEMPAVALKDRLARIVASSDTEAAPDYLRIVTPDLQPNGTMPNLATFEGQDAIDAGLGDARVIIVDNLSCLVRGGKENEADSWIAVQEWALRMRSAGRSIVFIHHAGKGGAQRGTSKREDILDVVMMLKRPANYRPEEGARFEIHFEKARPLYGQDVTAYEVRLETDATGRATWSTLTSDDSTEAQMIELAELGLSQTDIAREIGCHKSTVLRTLRKAEGEGRYRPKPRRSKNDGQASAKRCARNGDEF